MNNSFHIYQMRHLFKGDDHLGKYDTLTKILHLSPEFPNLREEAKAFFMRAHGIPVQVLVGDEEIKRAAPLMEFPDEIRALMSPQLGDLTPEVVTYARQHFTAREFNRRYQGRQPLEPEDVTPAPLIPGNTPVPATGLTLVPPPAPPTRDELKKLLKDKGIKFNGNAKTPDLLELWMDSNIDAAIQTPPPGEDIEPPEVEHHPVVPGAGEPARDDEENDPD